MYERKTRLNLSIPKRLDNVYTSIRALYVPRKYGMSDRVLDALNGSEFDSLARLLDYLVESASLD